MTQRIAIIAASRSPIGNFLGSLQTVPAYKIGSQIIKTLLQQSSLSNQDIDDVLLGQVLTAGAGQNPARQTVIEAGLSEETTAMTINQVCGSGLRSVALGVQAIASGDASIVIAGGQENMSLSPHALFLRKATKMGNGQAIDTMITDGLWDAFNDYHMGITAENIAKKYDISREGQDAFAAHSQNKAEAAQKAGKFEEEITPIIIKNRKGDLSFDKDEFIREGATPEGLQKLRPAFDKTGTVTAGNASGINDGAAMVLLMSEEEANKRGLTPLAFVESWATAGISPEIMGMGPVKASHKALEKAGWSLQDLDLIEANEAFAAQAIGVNREMGWDLNKVNVNGGAIALGHPIGASGARILVTLLHAMKDRDTHKGLATLCIGGGMGVALCVSR